MKTTIIIPLYNGAKYITRCLDSLSSQSYRDFEILVVDDNSTDESIAFCERFGVNLIRTPHNFGYAQAINYGVSKVDTDAIVILNQDTYADPDWLKNMVSSISQNGADMVAPNVLDLRTYPRKLQVGSPINFYPPLGMLYFGEIVKDCCPTNVIPGTGCLITRKVIDRLGLPFDDRFFMYWEDVDFSIRAIENGMSLIYQPKAVLWHRFHNASIPAMKLVTRNIHFILIKHFGLSFWMKALKWLAIQHLHLVKHYHNDYGYSYATCLEVISTAWLDAIAQYRRFRTKNFCSQYLRISDDILFNWVGKSLSHRQTIRLLGKRILLKG